MERPWADAQFLPRIGDEVLTRAEVSEVDLKAGHVRLTTRCSVQGKTVLEGEGYSTAVKATWAELSSFLEKSAFPLSTSINFRSPD